MTLRISVAGSTGWAGRAVAEAVIAAEDVRLVSAVSRGAAGSDLGTAWGSAPNEVPVFAKVDEALADVDVLIDYTAPDAVRTHVDMAIESGVGVVVGTSGLDAADYAEIDAAARSHGVGVVAAGNFSLTAALAQAAALLASRYVPSWEVVDYASAAKPDAPSGTATELAERLADVRRPVIGHPVSQTIGRPEARGASVGGGQVHAVRLPGYILSFEALFGLPDERLTIRHDAGTSAAPYVAGTLLAARAVAQRVGLTRRLDALLLGDDGQ